MIYRKIGNEQVPALGFGTYELTGDTGYASVLKALETGYRHIDTAEMYENEAEVGRAIEASGIKHRDLFLTSKVWFDHLRPHDMRDAIRRSLDKLRYQYLDLYMIHWPTDDVSMDEALETLMKLKEEGLTKYTGVCNFPPSLWKKAIHYGVDMIQVEYHVELSQQQLLQLCEDHDRLLTAYSPLAQGNLMQNTTVAEIGGKYNKSIPQIALKWLLSQTRVLAIPRSSKPENIVSNFDIFDFELEKEDLDKLWSMNGNNRYIQPAFAPNWNA